MRVFLDDSLFAVDSTCSPLQLCQLLALGLDERHVMLCEPLFDADNDEATVNQWCERQSRGLQLEIMTILEQGIDLNAQLDAAQATIRVSARCDDNWLRRGRQGHPEPELSPAMALSLLREPLHILLENSSNDLMFLRRLAPALLLEQLDRMLERRWAVADHGGGLGDMTRQVEELATSPSPIQRLRTWVLFDRDSNPNDRSAPSPDSERLRELIEQPRPGDPWPMVAQQLGRRSIENYLPDAVLSTWVEQARGLKTRRRREKVEALRGLRRSNPVAAHQYNMKRGLLGDLVGQRRHQVRDQIANDSQVRNQRPASLANIVHEADTDPIFHVLDADQRGALIVGFGEDVARLYQMELGAAWDELFEKEYNRGPQAQPTRQALLESLLRMG